MNKTVFEPSYGLAICENFNQVYAPLNDWLLGSEEWDNSRDGKVKEVLDFKTRLLNPMQRCVGGYGRDINIFFLLAEAIWITLGRKDVEFLKIFNSKMMDFSDDGETFHAPYGFRLRSYGQQSGQRPMKGVEFLKGMDQVELSLRLLQNNPNSRQICMTIWNPEFDLGAISKDIPCNDFVMLKVRDNKLVMTIANRSNDLHWGLPTNIFQFSFLSEIMCRCLGIEMGIQTHNSQSLHIYEWSEAAKNMEANWKKQQNILESDISGFEPFDLYESLCKAYPMEFNFSQEVAVNRFREIEIHLNLLVDNLLRVWRNEDTSIKEIDQLKDFSPYFYHVYLLLTQYVVYKKYPGKPSNEVKKCYLKALQGYKEYKEDWDFGLLAENFFAKRIEWEHSQGHFGKL
jgi:thymidylate synthase